MTRRRILALVSLLVYLFAQPAGADSPRDDLLHGVDHIIAPGVPGPLCAVGVEAHIVVSARTGADVYEPVVVAASWGSGRLVVFGHGGYFGDAAIQDADTSRLLTNAVEWTSRRSQEAHAYPPRVVVIDNDALAAHFRDAGFDARPARLQQLPDVLGDADVLIVDSHRLGNAAHRQAIRNFVRRGGGLLTAGLGWGWQQLHPNQSLPNDHPGNKLLGATGVVFADGYLQTTHSNGYDVSVGRSPYTHVQLALDLLMRHSRGDSEADNIALAQAAAVVTRAIQAVPDDHRLLTRQLAALDRELGRDIVPTEQSPITAADHPLQRVLLTRQLRMLETSPRVSRPHPAAESFPGPVPVSALRVRRTVTIDGAVPDWHSTGLYVPPGGMIRVTIPDAAVDGGLRIRIGAHKDQLWHKPNWKRIPAITVEQPIDRTRIEVDSPFGGLVYIVVPENCPLESVDVSIHRAVEAPLFSLGETDVNQWRSTIRRAAAPWGELATNKIILTLPSRVLRHLDDPQPLLQWWDTVLDAQADLRTINRQRRRPQRVVCDVQISAGYMHAGYPIMTHLDVAETFVDLERLKAGETWGIFHELGHNQQSPDWTFAGTGEVTCNLFTLYALEQCCTEGAKGHGAVQPDAIARRIEKHRDRGATFESWKSDPFLALIMYIQLQRAFGWDAYKFVFAEYESLPAEQRPRTEQQKRDQWMLRFSRTVGRNLGPFFQWWGVPTSEEARQEISRLPTWMPAELADLQPVSD